MAILTESYGGKWWVREGGREMGRGVEEDEEEREGEGWGRQGGGGERGGGGGGGGIKGWLQNERITVPRNHRHPLYFA